MSVETNSTADRRLTILPVHLTNPPGILAILDEVIVRLVQASRGCELGPWKAGKRAKSEPVHVDADLVEQEKARQCE